MWDLKPFLCSLHVAWPWYKSFWNFPQLENEAKVNWPGLAPRVMVGIIGTINVRWVSTFKRLCSCWLTHCWGEGGAHYRPAEWEGEAKSCPGPTPKGPVWSGSCDTVPVFTTTLMLLKHTCFKVRSNLLWYQTPTGLLLIPGLQSNVHSQEKLLFLTTLF